jgi:hypothetical protein
MLLVITFVRILLTLVSALLIYVNIPTIRVIVELFSMLVNYIRNYVIDIYSKIFIPHAKVYMMTNIGPVAIIPYIFRNREFILVVKLRPFVLNYVRLDTGRIAKIIAKIMQSISLTHARVTESQRSGKTFSFDFMINGYCHTAYCKRPGMMRPHSSDPRNIHRMQGPCNDFHKSTTVQGILFSGIPTREALETLEFN